MDAELQEFKNALERQAQQRRGRNQDHLNLAFVTVTPAEEEAISRLPVDKSGTALIQDDTGQPFFMLDVDSLGNAPLA